MSNLATLRLLQSQSLPDVVREEVKRLILQGVYKPGDKLGEEELAEKLGVSRGPIREAFRGLEQSGLVRVAKNRGVFVRVFTLDEARDLYFVRGGIEEMIARTLATTISDTQLSDLALLLETMEANLAAKDLDSYFENDVLFHDKIVQLTGNYRLIEIHRSLTNEMNLIRFHSLRSGGIHVSNAEHGAMLDALTQRDADTAIWAFRAHISNAFNRVVPLLVQNDREKAPPTGNATSS
jgi:DNA-binding GntR family transcriptional regulator